MINYFIKDILTIIILVQPKFINFIQTKICLPLLYSNLTNILRYIHKIIIYLYFYLILGINFIGCLSLAKIGNPFVGKLFPPL